jgi:hypothetical protein
MNSGFDTKFLKHVRQKSAELTPRLPAGMQHSNAQKEANLTTNDSLTHMTHSMKYGISRIDIYKIVRYRKVKIQIPLSFRSRDPEA